MTSVCVNSLFISIVSDYYLSRKGNKKLNKSTLHSILILLALGLIWGSGYVIAKFAIENGVAPLGYSFWQCAGPALLLSIIIYLRKYPKSQPTPWIFYSVCGILGIAVPNSIMYFSAPHLPAGILAVIVNTVPLFIYPLALTCQAERFHPWRLAGLLLGFAGIILLMFPNVSMPGNDHLHWVLLTFITPLCFALCALYINHHAPENRDVLQQSTGMLISAAIVITPIILWQDAFYPINLPLQPADGAILLEIILSSLGYLLFFKLITQAGPVYYSLVGGVVCLTGLLWGYLLFDETLNFLSFLSVGLILMAIFIVSITQALAPKGHS